MCKSLIIKLLYIKFRFQKIQNSHFDLYCIKIYMFYSRMPNKVQKMNHIYTSKEAGELWLGDYYAATNINMLKQKNIKSVLTSASMLGVKYPKELEMNHKIINALDLPSFKMTPFFEQAFQFIDQALKKGNILVHCAAGISRSTTFVIVYLMRTQNMTFKQAFDFVRARRSIVCPNDGFQKELKRYEIAVKRLILPKIQKEKQENMIKSQNLEEKQAPLNSYSFAKDLLRNQTKLSATFNSNVSKPQDRQDNKGIDRGKSLNLSLKPNNQKLKQMKVKVQLQKKGNDKKEQKATAFITKQLLTFKLENPRIVTIKK